MVQRVTNGNPKLPEAAPPPAAPTPRSGATVTVACKVPNGLFLELYVLEDGWEPTPLGGRTPLKKARAISGKVHINGPGTPLSVAGFPIIRGYALTTIPADFWEQWLAQNQDSDLVKNKVLFAHENPDHVRGRVQEQAKDKVKSGFEPIDPKSPPKVGGLRVQTYATEVQNSEVG